MGKEILYKSKEIINSSYYNTDDYLNFSFDYLAPEINSLWDPINITKKEAITENGRVFIILKTQTTNTNITLNGFKKENNDIKNLFKRLLELQLITLDTRLLSLLKLQGDVWHKVSPRNSVFNSEDAFIVVAKHYNISNQINKSI